jgi:hypothetical protein
MADRNAVSKTDSRPSAPRRSTTGSILDNSLPADAESVPAICPRTVQIASDRSANAAWTGVSPLVIPVVRACSS